MKVILTLIFIGITSGIVYAQHGEVYEADDMQAYHNLKINQNTDFLYFSKPNCPWCDKEDPVVRKLAKDFPKIRFIKLISTHIGSLNGVNLYPTIIYKGKRYVGFKDEYELRRILNNQPSPFEGANYRTPVAPLRRFLGIVSG